MLKKSDDKNMRFRLVYCYNLLIVLFFPLLLNAQNTYSDFIILKNNNIISCEIKHFFDRTVVFQIENKSQTAAIFAIQVIHLQDHAVVYREDKGYLYSIDTLNTYIESRGGTKRKDKILTENDACQGTFHENSQQQISPSRNEFSIATGGLTTAQAFNILNDFITVFSTLGNYSKKEYDNTTLLISYRHLLENNNLEIGIDISYESFASHIVSKNKKIGTLKTYFITLAAEASYYWINSDYIQIYSAAGLGIMVIDYQSRGPFTVDVEQPLFPGINVSVVGFKIGYKLYLLGEIGFGYRGLVTIGAAYQF